MKGANMPAYADQGVNQRRLRTLQKQYGFEIVQAHDIEQNIAIANSVPHPFIISISTLGGGDYLADSDIDEIDGIMGTTNISKKGGKDTLHIYTAYHAGCAYFITANPYDFIYNSRKDKTDGKRQRLEALLKGMRIVTLDEFEDILAAHYPAIWH